MVGSDYKSEGYFDVDVSNEAVVDEKWIVNQHLNGFVGGIGRRMVREEISSMVGLDDKKEAYFDLEANKEAAIESDVGSDDESMVGSDDESEGYFDVDVSTEAVVDEDWMVNQHLDGFVGGIGRKMVREELTSVGGEHDL